MNETVHTPLRHDGVVRRLARGFGMQGLTSVAQLAVQFLVVPVCLSAWGTAVYADWLVLSAAAGLLTLADLGIYGYLSNSLRLAWARGDWSGGQRLLQAGIGIYLILTGSVITALALTAWAVDIPARLGVSHLEEARTIQILLALAAALLLPRGLVATVYSARGAFDREIASFLVLLTGQQGVTILGALAGGTPLQVATASVVASVVFGWGWLLWGLRRRYPNVALRPCRATGAEIRTLAAKAPLYAVEQGSSALFIHIPVIILGRMATPDIMVAFTTMRTFTGLVRQTASQFATATGLELARMHACGDLSGAARLYAGSAPLAGGMIGLLAGTALVVGPPFFALWTRGAVPFDPVLATVFLTAVLLMTPAYGAAGLLRLVDRPGAVAAGQVAQMAAGIALCLLLIPEAGALGAALAIGGAEILTSGPYMMRVAGRLLDRPMLPPAVRTYVAAAAGFGFGMLMSRAVTSLIPITSGPSLLAFAALWGAGLGAPVAALALDAGRRAWLLACWRRVVRPSR